MKDLLIGKGQILVEILITLSLVAVFLIVIYYMFNSNQILSLESVNYLNALNLANDEVEKLRDLSRTNFDQVVSSTKTSGNFIIETIVNDIDLYTKKVDLKVSWNLNKPHSLTLTSYFVNWKNIPVDDGSGGASGGGGGGLSGDWKHPTTLSSADLGPGNEGTDVNVKFNTAFVSAVASDSKKPDLFVIDVSNPSQPSIKSTLNTGPGANSISVKGNYAYLANNNTVSQLQIVDISNENSPVLVKEVTLPNNGRQALSVFAFQNYVVIGTYWSIGKEVFIYDVTDVLNPNLLSSLEIFKSGDFFNVRDLFVLRNRLYVAAESSSEGALFVYDITNSSLPVFLYSFYAPQGKRAFSVFPLSNNLVFLGTIDYLYLLDTSNISNIKILGSYNAGGKINDIYARENLAFLATSNPNQEFQVVDYSDLNNLYLYSYYNFPQEATGIDYRNNLIFVSVRSNDALRIITSQ